MSAFSSPLASSALSHTWQSVLDLASITSSVLDYEFENGRRYHAYRAGSYPIPNDEVSMDFITLRTCWKARYTHQPVPYVALANKSSPIGGVRENRPQASYFPASVQRAYTLGTPGESRENPRPGHRDWYLGHRDGRSIPWINGNWDGSISGSTYLVCDLFLL